jgi:hypothetical protein
MACALRRSGVTDSGLNVADPGYILLDTVPEQRSSDSHSSCLSRKETFHSGWCSAKFKRGVSGQTLVRFLMPFLWHQASPMEP